MSSVKAKKKASKKVTKKGPRKGRHPPFKKGNQIGKATRFKPGQPGGPGRMPKWESPRDMIAWWLARNATPKMIAAVRRAFPDIPEDATRKMLMAGICALKLIEKGMSGDVRAIETLIKQADDLGVDKSKVEHDGGVEVYKILIPDNDRS